MNEEQRKRPGRKSKGGQRYNIRLTDEVADELRLVGDDEMTRGIEVLAEQSIKRRERKSKRERA